MEEIYSLTEVYASLPVDDATLLKSLIEEYGEEGAIDKWIDTIPPEQLPMTHFSGGIGDSDEPFSKRLKDEINMVICGHPKYKEEREKILHEYNGYTLTAATSLGAIIGSVFGIASGAVIPVALIMIRLALKVTVGAYCKNYKYAE